jgi:hypothetical protein
VRRLTPCHTTGGVSRTANPASAATSQHTSQHVSGVETMSTTQPWARTAAAPPLRVRDQARAAAALIAFSAATASCLALGLLLLTYLGHQG